MDRQPTQSNVAETVHPSERLDGSGVLIVEDEPFIALDLAAAVEDAGGSVVGPAPTVELAIRLAEVSTIKAAVLDVDLPDGQIGPVLELLDRRGIVVLIHTGVGLSLEQRQRFAHVPVYAKPTPTAKLVQELAKRLQSQ